MPLRMEVGLGPGHIVLHGDPDPPPQKKGAQQPSTFRPMSVAELLSVVQFAYKTESVLPEFISKLLYLKPCFPADFQLTFKRIIYILSKFDSMMSEPRPTNISSGYVDTLAIERVINNKRGYTKDELENRHLRSQQPL